MLIIAGTLILDPQDCDDYLVAVAGVATYRVESSG